MAGVKPMTSTDISEIQRQMAQVRHEMHHEVQSAVKSAQSMTDWRTLAKCHPWLSLAAASIVGYVVVPRRRSETPTIVTVGTANHALLPAAASPDRGRKHGSVMWTVLGTAASVLAPIAIRVGQNYALGRLEQWLSQHPLPPVPASSSGGPKRDGSQSVGEAGGRLRDYA